MEIPIIMGLVSAGYFLNKDGIKRSRIEDNNKNDFYRNKNKEYLSKDDMNGENIYKSEKSFKIRQCEQESANKLWAKAGNLEENNVVISGPPIPILNKIDYDNKRLPIEFNNNQPNSHNLHNDSSVYNTNDLSYLSNVSNLDSSGFNKMNLKGDKLNSNTFVSLSGTEMKAEQFVHNNMAPFFGGSIKQNVDEYATSAVLENYTGNINNYQKKKEIPTMFKPTTNVSNVYGAQNLDENNYDRYVVGNIRNNIGPIEKINVGPGLNQGYTWKPSGGVQQEDTREYVMPKSTNELRVKTNPKLSYHNRIISGQAINKPGKVGKVEKNRPDNFSIWGQERLFTTVGKCKGQRQRSKVLLQNSNRVTTGQKKRVNPAGPAVFHKNKAPMGKIAPTFKQVLRSLGFGNTKTTDNSHIRNNQKPRHTRKTNVVGNPRWASNIQGPHNRHTVYDPNDVARTTIKETTIHDSIKNNLAPANRPQKNLVYDPNDIAKITIKETTFVEGHFNNPSKEKDDGYINASGVIKAPVTYRQGYEDSDYIGDAQGPESGGYQIADPEAKNTTRQFTSNIQYDGIAGPGGKDKGMSYEDIYNSTITSLRQEVAEGRAPATQGAKSKLNSDNINVNLNKEPEINNTRIDDRGVTSTKVYNSLPTMNKCEETTDKASLPNAPLRNRLDPAMVDAFKENPYTHSLKSYVFP